MPKLQDIKEDSKEMIFSQRNEEIKKNRRRSVPKKESDNFVEPFKSQGTMKDPIKAKNLRMHSINEAFDPEPELHPYLNDKLHTLTIT